MPGFVTVSVRQGDLRGRYRQTPGRKDFLSFQGVPYAKPPVGELRFKAPQPAEAWAGVRDATREGSPCLHIDTIAKRMVGSEDCLFLNVFTRRLPTGAADDRPRAVIVWIHGGGFTEGSGNDWGPEYFMEHDVIFVTFNYRLGPLGFLSLGTKELPGNAGLKDQVMALRWVQENIAVFGGDPDNVTLFGESAGGACAHFHWMSPLSKGLFRRLIFSSGCGLCWWSLTRDSVGRARRLAVAAGCDAAILDDSDALLQWLRQLPAQELLQAVKAARTEEERKSFISFPFVPVLEPEHPGAFLTTDPHRVMAERLAGGRAHAMPVLMGLMSHEGILRLPGVLTPEAWERADENFEYLLPYDVVADPRDSERTQDVCQRIKDFYVGGKKLSEETAEGYVHYSTDMMFAHMLYTAARVHSRLGAPVYMFEFAFVGRLNMFGPLYGAQRVPGACHADELGYLFHVERLPPVEDDSPEARVRRRMVRMWVDFAQGGNPTPTNEENSLKWETFSEVEPNYLRISDELSLNTGLLKERLEFWDNLYRTEGTQRRYLDNQIDTQVGIQDQPKEKHRGGLVQLLEKLRLQ